MTRRVLRRGAACCRLIHMREQEPLIKNCSCGKDHMTMPTDIDIDEDGNAFEYPLVCVIHKKHEPCRRCLAKEGFYDENGRVRKDFL